MAASGGSFVDAARHSNAGALQNAESGSPPGRSACLRFIACLFFQFAAGDVICSSSLGTTTSWRRAASAFRPSIRQLRAALSLSAQRDVALRWADPAYYLVKLLSWVGRDLASLRRKSSVAGAWSAPDPCALAVLLLPSVVANVSMLGQADTFWVAPAFWPCCGREWTMVLGRVLERPCILLQGAGAFFAPVRRASLRNTASSVADLAGRTGSLSCSDAPGMDGGLAGLGSRERLFASGDVAAGRRLFHQQWSKLVDDLRLVLPAASPENFLDWLRPRVHRGRCGRRKRYQTDPPERPTCLRPFRCRNSLPAARNAPNDFAFSLTFSPSFMRSFTRAAVRLPPRCRCRLRRHFRSLSGHCKWSRFSCWHRL